MSRAERVYIGLGSNLNNPASQIDRALAALRAAPQIDVSSCSNLYRSAPVGLVDQPDFVNAVCALTTMLQPLELLSFLSETEARLGRIRGPQKDGPRIIDIDILLYGVRTLSEGRLKIPHPEMHKRAFVLYPLREIAPDIRIPGLGDIGSWIEQCTDQEVSILKQSDEQRKEFV